MRIGTALRDGWSLLRRDAWVLIVAAFLIAVIGTVTIGLLYLPLEAGLFLMVLNRVRRGRAPRVRDVFGVVSPFSRWFVAWLIMVGAAMVAGVAFAVVGMILALTLQWPAPRLQLAIFVVIVPSVFLGTLWMYIAPLMGERQIGLWESLGQSYRVVRGGGFWRHMGVIALVSVLSWVVGQAVTLVVDRLLGVAGNPPGWFIVRTLIASPVTAVVSAFVVCVVAAAYIADNREGQFLPSAAGGGAWPPPDREEQYLALQAEWAAQWQAYYAAQQQLQYAAQPQPPAAPSEA